MCRITLGSTSCSGDTKLDRCPCLGGLAFAIARSAPMPSYTLDAVRRLGGFSATMNCVMARNTLKHRRLVRRS